MAPSVLAVRQFLVENTRQFRIDESRGVAFWRLWGERSCYASTLRFYADQELVVLTLRFCHLVPQSLRSSMLRLLTRMNHGLARGNFEMDLESGEIRLRMDLDHEGAAVDSRRIERMVMSARRLADHYAYTLFKVICGADDLEALLVQGSEGVS